MRIICPFVTHSDPKNNRLNLQDATRDFVASIGGEFHFVGGNDYEYYALLKRVWSEQRTTAIVEHDVLPDLDAINSLAECVEWWCACPYYMGGQIAPGLGCTKFAAELMKMVPDLFDRVAALNMGDINPHTWVRLDVSIDMVLIQQLGYKVHCHEEHPVRHLKVYY